jgi:hypothetical protein
MIKKRFGPRVYIGAKLPANLHNWIARKARKDHRSKSQTIAILLVAARAFLCAKNIIEKPAPPPPETRYIGGWLSVHPPIKLRNHKRRKSYGNQTSRNPR